MRINFNPAITNYNNKPQFKAINLKYYEWALRDHKRGRGVSTELLEELHFEVDWGDIHPQDGIDTLKAIIDLDGRIDECIMDMLASFKRRLND